MRRRAVTGALLSLPVLGTAQAQARPRVGAVETVTGRALAHYGTLPPRPLAPEAAVLLDDMLATDPDARLACRLTNGVELRLGGNATLRVDRLALGGSRRGILLESLSGPLLVDRPPQASAVPLTLDLPWARIGVRGTRFFAGPLDAVFAVFCAHGVVRVRTPDGREATLAEGEGTDMPQDGAAPPLRVTRWGAPRIARALALVE